MSRKILCRECNNRLSKLAERYSEYHESLEGKAIGLMHCDSCYKQIKPGDECFATSNLPSEKHFNYEKDRPEKWASELINYTMKPLHENFKLLIAILVCAAWFFGVVLYILGAFTFDSHTAHVGMVITIISSVLIAVSIIKDASKT